MDHLHLLGFILLLDSSKKEYTLKRLQGKNIHTLTTLTNEAYRRTRGVDFI